MNALFFSFAFVNHWLKMALRGHYTPNLNFRVLELLTLLGGRTDRQTDRQTDGVQCIM